MDWNHTHRLAKVLLEFTTSAFAGFTRTLGQIFNPAVAMIFSLKTLFFSLVACMRNFWAFTVFGLVWMSVLIFAILVVSLFAGLIGSPEVAGLVLMPAALLVAAMFFTSTYFSFRDCFETSAEETP